MITVEELTGILHRDSHPRLWMTMGRLVLEKSNRIMRHSEWMPHLEKFSEKSYQAFSSRNRTWKRVGSEEDAPKRRGFQDEADLCFGAMRKLSKRERERERERERDKQKSTIIIEYQKIEKKWYYTWKMHEHVICKKKLHHGFNPIQIYQHTIFNI